MAARNHHFELKLVRKSGHECCHSTLRLPEPLYTLDGIGYNQGKDVLAISIVELEKPKDFSASYEQH
jgi:hypothetical protein